jgi:hypothetical protein
MHAQQLVSATNQCLFVAVYAVPRSLMNPSARERSNLISVVALSSTCITHVILHMCLCCPSNSMLLYFFFISAPCKNVWQRQPLEKKRGSFTKPAMINDVALAPWSPLRHNRYGDHQHRPSDGGSIYRMYNGSLPYWKREILLLYMVLHWDDLPLEEIQGF